MSKLISIFDNMNWEYCEKDGKDTLYTMKKPNKTLYKKIVAQMLAIDAVFGGGRYEWIFYPKKMQMLHKLKR